MPVFLRVYVVHPSRPSYHHASMFSSGRWRLPSAPPSPTCWRCLTSSVTAATASIWTTRPATQCCRCCWPPRTTTLCSRLPRLQAVWKESSLLPSLYQRDFQGKEQRNDGEKLSLKEKMQTYWKNRQSAILYRDCLTLLFSFFFFNSNVFLKDGSEHPRMRKACSFFSKKCVC